MSTLDRTEGAWYPNTTKFSWVNITTRLDGTMLRVPLHVVTGAQDGPTLALTSGLHGSEWLGIEVFRRLLGMLNPDHMRGRVLVVPVGNPHAFQHLTRNTPDESDEPDLNRVFPGGDTWLTVQIAREIERTVLRQADYLIDFHAGIWGSAMGEVGYGQDVPNVEVSNTARAIAYAFGYPCVRRLNVMSGFPGPRAICAYAAAKLDVPAISASIGGCGFAPELEDQWIEANVQGIRNVMAYLGILEGVPARPSRYVSFEGRGYRVVPSIGGYLDPVLPADSLMKEVQQGELLARVISPYSFQELELLRSPVHGVLFGVARAYPVMPGDWAYFVADLDDEGTYWTEGAE